MDLTDLLAAFFVALVTGAGGRILTRHSRPRLTTWIMVVTAFVAAVIASIIAGIADVSDTPGFEWVERLLQVVFASASLWSLVLATGPARSSSGR